MTVRLFTGDSVTLMAALPESSVDAIVTDPPYHLTQNSRGGHARTNNPATPHGRHRIGDKGFMGKVWDGGDVAFRVETWLAAFRVLKPGGHLVAFGGTRTYHRLVCAIEDAGFEIRDMGAWLYGNGFPKSENPCKCKPHVDAGAVDTHGWKLCETCKLPFELGTALKPAHEPICFARKPLIGTVVENFQMHGTGALNIESCRVPLHGESIELTGRGAIPCRQDERAARSAHPIATREPDLGRWPANLIHDGSDEVVALFPESAGAAAPVHRRNGDKFRNSYGDFAGRVDELGSTFHGDAGSAARFFYAAKANAGDRDEGMPPGLSNTHPTVKPTDLMRHLVRLVTPPRGTVLDLFMGSGSTGKACVLEGFDFIGMDLEPQHVEIARHRIEHARLPASIRAIPRKKISEVESSGPQSMLFSFDSVGNILLPFLIESTETLI